MKLTLGKLLLIAGIIILVCGAFFLVTSTMSSPVTMELNIPRDSAVDGRPASVSLILLKDNMIYAYDHDKMREGKSIPFNELHQLLNESIKRHSTDSLNVLIKATEEATYRNVVDALDEMAITGIAKYAVTDINKEEKEFLKSRN